MSFKCKVIIQNLLLSLSCALFCHNLAWATPSPEGIQVYHKYLPEIRKQNLAEDINRYNQADDLWDILRDEFSLPHYENIPLVQEQIDWFMSHQEFLLHSTTHAAPYLYYIHQQAKKRRLPAEFVLLPIIESAYNPFAYSPAGAAGIWQMMPATASGYGIKQDWWYDGRRDVIASTKAALNYLAYLNNFFEGNWLLTIAAYDSGEGTVLSAIRRNIRDGLSTDYWNLPLPKETHIYVPRLLALATIIAHPEKYPIYLPPVRNAPYLAQVEVDAKIDLKRAANLAGISLKQLWQLNPGYNRSTAMPRGIFKLVIPIENVEQFTENIAHLPSLQHATTYVYKARYGDTIKTIADRFYVSPTMLRKINQLSSNTVKPGVNLIIPRHSTTDNKIQSAPGPKYFAANATNLPARSNPVKASTTLSDKAKSNNYKLQSGDTIYMVRTQDTLKSIAKRFNLAPQALINANKLGKRTVKAGEKLVIPTHTTLTKKTLRPTDSNYRLDSGDIVYLVKGADTMEKIAKKFHTTPASIRVANLMTNNRIHPGDRLIIPASL